MSRRGRFITFEGGEGVGKTTQIPVLRDRLAALGLTVLATREPGGTAGAEAIRRLLVAGDSARWDAMSEALLHFAARRDHVMRVIAPALERGDWVVCDRFVDSTMAYQGYAQGLGRRVIETLHALVLAGFSPDLTIILDLDSTEALARAQVATPSEGRPKAGDYEEGDYEEGDYEEGQPEEGRYEAMGQGFHARVRAGFREIAAGAPERCVLLSAAGAKEAVAERVWQAVRARLGAHLP